MLAVPPPGGRRADRVPGVRRRCYGGAAGVWADVPRDAREGGVRNAQATLSPPTGTVSVMLDCETTGVEPYYALAGTKRLANGGEIRLSSRVLAQDCWRSATTQATSRSYAGTPPSTGTSRTPRGCAPLTPSSSRPVAGQRGRVQGPQPAWARRCRLAPFVKLAKTITKQRPGIEAAIQHGLSNARIEQVNTQLRPITRRAYGFRTPQPLIALAMLSLSGLCPLLPT